MAEFLDVVFNIPVDQRFTYAPPEGQEAGIGVRVVAPFGPRRLTGYVVGTSAEAPPGVAEIRRLQRVIDREPLFDAGTVALARWVADMYLCALGEALAAMLPGGRREADPEATELDGLELAAEIRRLPAGAAAMLALLWADPRFVA